MHEKNSALDTIASLINPKVGLGHRVDMAHGLQALKISYGPTFQSADSRANLLTLTDFKMAELAANNITRQCYRTHQEKNRNEKNSKKLNVLIVIHLNM